MKLYASFLPYLLLVTFYSPGIQDFGPNKVQSINRSPYNGVALQLVDGYSTSRAVPELALTIARFKRACRKHVWPWIFFNRFVGAERGAKKVPKSNREYWFSIKGMDLYDEAGALGHFYRIWRKALEVARELGSPGIVVDPEPYNDYGVYEVSYLAKKLSRPTTVVKARLKDIGRRLTDIADEVYPEATVWLLFSGLGTPERNWLPLQEKEYRTVTYIVMGMLERAAERRSNLRFVSGGEVSLGYCFLSLQDLTAKMARRSENFASFSTMYPNLILGGTISPWRSVQVKRDWLLRDKCGQSSLKTIEDFGPLFEKLFESYGYVWIYAAGAAEFDPYDPVRATVYHEVLAQALAKANRREKPISLRRSLKGVNGVDPAR